MMEPMLKMEDSGVESDSRCGDAQKSCSTSTDEYQKNDEYENIDFRSQQMEDISNQTDDSLDKESLKSTAKLIPTSVLQKHLERQVIQTRKFRQKESIDAFSKKLLPHSRLKVPRGQNPIVTKNDAHPLVSWESDSDDEIDYHSVSKSAAMEITEQLIKDGYNLDLTPDDEDLDLIPPKPLSQRYVCCNLSCMCLIQ